MVIVRTSSEPTIPFRVAGLAADVTPTSPRSVIPEALDSPASRSAAGASRSARARPTESIGTPSDGPLDMTGRYQRTAKAGRGL
jgi:hypothetical protein